MIISFSGAQSTGKTTLLKECQTKFQHLEYVPEVTRLVKREYNLPINEEGNNITQTMIMSMHMHNAFINRTKDCVLDRCSLDGIVYTHWLCNKRHVTMDVYTHARSVFNATIDRYDCILYPEPNDVQLVDDGERSVDIDFRNEIIELFDQYKRFVPTDKIVTLKGSVEERMKQIETIFKTFNIVK